MFDSPSILKRLAAAKTDDQRIAILDEAILARRADHILVNCSGAHLPDAGHRFTGYTPTGSSLLLRGELPAPGTLHEQDGQTYYIASHRETSNA